MIQPTALNFVVIGLMVVIFSFMWRMVSSWLVDRNADSELGKAMAAVHG